MPLGEILSNITVDHVRGDYGERNGNPLQYSCLENPMGEELVELQYMWSQCIGHTQRLNKQEEIQFSYSVMSDSLDPINRSTPGLRVHHQLPEFTQTHIHRVGGAIQPSHPLSSPFPPVPNPSQHQRLFQ